MTTIQVDAIADVSMLSKAARQHIIIRLRKLLLYVNFDIW
jgi:hypothetical protein